MTLSPGSGLGPYEVVALLGAGGMGEVYRARDTKLNRDVAIKVLPEAVAGDADRRARFHREAQVLASLNHPNIAHIHGYEESSGTPALVMELVEGPTLADRIAQVSTGKSQVTGLPLDEALAIARQIAEALEAAHEQGIVHRDLKPANIKVREDGAVKVLDFGLAKILDPAPGSGLQVPGDLTASPTITSPAMMTGVGLILGTAAYMSPEQAKGRPVDKRADLWAFGAVLYEMLSGRRAFAGEDVSDTLARVLMKEPDWSALPATTPAPIAKLLRRCLEKDRKRRLPDAAMIRLEFDETLTTPDVPASSTRTAVAKWPRWTWGLVTVAAAVAGAAIAAAVLAGTRGSTLAPAPATAMRFPIALPPGESFTSTGYPFIAMSPDGSAVAYVANRQLYLRRLTDLQARPIAGAADTTIDTPFFSPDGQWVAFHDPVDRRLKKVALAGGATVTICDLPFTPLGITWDASNQILVGAGSRGVLRVPASGGEAETIIKLKPGEQAFGPQLLPDGDSILFTLGDGPSGAQWDRGHVVVQSLKSGSRTVVLEGTDGRYTSTGHLLYAVDTTVFAVPFDVKRLQVTAAPVPVIDGAMRAVGATTGASMFGVSNSGSMVYVPGTSARSSRVLSLVDRSGARRNLNVPPGLYYHARFSPDGKTIAFHASDGRDLNIWAYDMAGDGTMRRLTFSDHNSSRPIWSPDGRRIVFQSDREGDAGLFWQRADGSGVAERVTKAEPNTSHQPEVWARTGEVILALRVGRGLWSVVPGKAEKPTPLIVSSAPGFTGANSSLSPDGRWLAYLSGESGVNQIYVQPYPPTGAKYQLSTRGDTQDSLWAPDGRELYYLEGGGRTGSRVASVVAVEVQTQPGFRFGRTTTLPVQEILENEPRPYDISPDGKTFVTLMPLTEQDAAATSRDQMNIVLNWFDEVKRIVPKP